MHLLCRSRVIFVIFTLYAKSPAGYLPTVSAHRVIYHHVCVKRPDQGNQSPFGQRVQKVKSTATDGVHHTLLGLSKLDCSTNLQEDSNTQRRTSTSSESSRRHVSNTDLVGTDTISDCGDIDHGKSAQGSVTYTAHVGQTKNSFS